MAVAVRDRNLSNLQINPENFYAHKPEGKVRKPSELPTRKKALLWQILNWLSLKLPCTKLLDKNAMFVLRSISAGVQNFRHSQRHILPGGDRIVASANIVLPPSNEKGNNFGPTHSAFQQTYCLEGFHSESKCTTVAHTYSYTRRQIMNLMIQFLRFFQKENWN